MSNLLWPGWVIWNFFSGRNMKIISLFFILIFCNQIHAKTLFFGDSLTAAYGNSGRELMGGEINIEYISGSGLINDNKKDWIAFVNKSDLRKYDDIIISLGVNDFVKYNSEAREKYYARIFKLISEIQKQNPLASVIWLSPLHLKNPEHEKYLINTRGIIKVSTALMNVKYIDVNQPDLLGTEWQPVMDGQKIRTDDGIHITRVGSYRVVRELIKNMNNYH